jgi:hypothetical protein
LDDGLFVNAPDAARKGDEVWVVKGGKLPLILRAARSPQSEMTEAAELHPRFTLVGDCYVHGIMDGEKVPDQDEKWQKIFLA